MPGNQTNMVDRIKPTDKDILYSDTTAPMVIFVLTINRYMGTSYGEKARPQ